jgi:hypothetical protein
LKQAQDKGPSYFFPGMDTTRKHRRAPESPRQRWIRLRYHPTPQVLSLTAKKLIARNAYQVLCPDLKTSSQFVVCWTPDGCIDQAGRSRQTGATVQAVAIATSNGIEVIKLRRPDHREFVMASMNGKDAIPVIAKNFPRL